MGRGKRDQRGPKRAQEEGQEERRSHEQEGGGGVGEGRGGSEEKGKNHMRHEAAQEWDPKNARALSKGESSHIIMESIESITSELLRPRASRGLACYCKVGSHLRAPPAKLHQDPPFPEHVPPPAICPLIGHYPLKTCASQDCLATPHSVLVISGQLFCPILPCGPPLDLPSPMAARTHLVHPVHFPVPRGSH
jgi:hypothetical protein